MGFSINNSHRLLRDGRLVEKIPSRRQHTNGQFGKTPNILIVHFTYGGSGRSSANWFADPNNPFKSSAHVVVDRDGSVLQCVEFSIGANHAGASSWRGLDGFNNKSFGIELANWGYLRASGTGWSSYTGVAVANPTIAAHKNGNPPGWPASPIGWEPYPVAQIESAVGIAQALVSRYGVDTILGHDDISAKRKWDPGPAFDMTRFRNAVFADRAVVGPNTFLVASPNGLNLRRGPGIEHAVQVTLPDGTAVQPVEERDNWTLVNVLETGVPKLTGWVHSTFLEENRN